MSSSAPSTITQLRALSRSLTTGTLKSTDRTLLHLQRILSTPIGIDSTLLTIGYSLTLLAAILNARLEAHLAKLAEVLANKASSALLPGEKIVAEFPADPTTQRLVKLSQSAKATAGAISDFRMFTRMWGLLDIYAGARRLYAVPPNDVVRKLIGWTQLLSIGGYQFLENSVYLAKKGVLNTSGWTGVQGAQRSVRWFKIASQLWMVYTGAEFARLGYEWYQWKEAEAAKQGEKEDKITREETQKAAELWRRKAIINSGYAPMTIHYSVDGGCLTDAQVGLLGTIVGAAKMSALWRETA